MDPGQVWERLKATLVPQGTVSERAAKSGVWVTLLNVSDRALQFIKLIFLARLLPPSEFGLMGIAFLSLAVLEQFSQLGINKALIQRNEENIDEYLSTAWSMKLVRGLVIGTIGFVAAPYISTLFGEPRATDVIRVIAVVPLLNGIRNPGIVYLRKELQFDKQFVYKITGTAANVVVSIVLAYELRNVWALVFGTVLGSLVTMVVSFMIHSFRPRLELQLATVRELFGYGKWLTVSSMLIFVYSQGDDAFVGWFLGATALGFYQMAYRISNIPSTEITQVISQVAFPTYSKLQDDVEKLRNAYFHTLEMSVFVSAPLSTGIILMTPDFIRVFMSPEWYPMATAMQLLTLWGFLRSTGATTGPLFEAIGRPDYNTKLHVTQVAVIAITIYPFTDRFGIEGAALAVVASSVIPTLGSYYLALSETEGTYRRFLNVLGYPVLGSVAMGAAVLYTQQHLAAVSPAIQFTCAVAVGVVTYVAGMWAANQYLTYDIEAALRLFTTSLGSTGSA